MDPIYYVSQLKRTKKEPVRGWYVDVGADAPEGPYRTREDAEAYLATRENWQQFYAGS